MSLGGIRAVRMGAGEETGSAGGRVDTGNTFWKLETEQAGGVDWCRSSDYASPQVQVQLCPEERSKQFASLGRPLTPCAFLIFTRGFYQDMNEVSQDPWECLGR